MNIRGHATNLEKVSEDGNPGRARERDGMRSTTQHAIKDPEDATYELAPCLESAEEESSKDNGPKSIDNAKISGAIDQLRGDLESATSHG